MLLEWHVIAAGEPGFTSYPPRCGMMLNERTGRLFHRLIFSCELPVKTQNPEIGGQGVVLGHVSRGSSPSDADEFSGGSLFHGRDCIAVQQVHRDGCQRGHEHVQQTGERREGPQGDGGGPDQEK